MCIPIYYILLGPTRVTHFLGSTCVHVQNDISIGSAAFVGLTIVTDRPTDRQTDRQTALLRL